MYSGTCLMRTSKGTQISTYYQGYLLSGQCLQPVRFHISVNIMQYSFFSRFIHGISHHNTYYKLGECSQLIMLLK